MALYLEGVSGKKGGRKRWRDSFYKSNPSRIFFLLLFLFDSTCIRVGAEAPVEVHASLALTFLSKVYIIDVGIQNEIALYNEQSSSMTWRVVGVCGHLRMC